MEEEVKKFLGVAAIALLVVSLAFAAACSKKSEGIVGTWGMVGAPEKTVKITKEVDNYFYEGSQGKTPAKKQDENTLIVPMGPIEVTAKLDPATGVLSVSFMGESYQYKKVQ